MLLAEAADVDEAEEALLLPLELEAPVLVDEPAPEEAEEEAGAEEVSVALSEREDSVGLAGTLSLMLPVGAALPVSVPGGSEPMVERIVRGKVGEAERDCAATSTEEAPLPPLLSSASCARSRSTGAEERVAARILGC